MPGNIRKGFTEPSSENIFKQNETHKTPEEQPIASGKARGRMVEKHCPEKKIIPNTRNTHDSSGFIRTSWKIHSDSDRRSQYLTPPREHLSYGFLKPPFSGNAWQPVDEYQPCPEYSGQKTDPKGIQYQPEPLPFESPYFHPPSDEASEYSNLYEALHIYERIDEDSDSDLYSELSEIHRQPEGENSQVAGHAGCIMTLSDRLIAKMTTAEETEIYQWQHTLGLDSIIPKTVDAEALSPGEREALAPLLKRAEEQGREIIIPERLGARIPERRKMEMDIKLGFDTASVEQLSRSGHPHPHRKKARHGIMDRLFKSKERGYRVEGYNNKGEPVDQNRLRLTKNSNEHIKQLINSCGIENRRRIIGSLREIRDQLQQADITFMASSLLVVVDTEQPENTQIKLIDLAHPVYPGWGDYQKYKKDLIRGLDRLIDYSYRCIE